MAVWHTFIVASCLSVGLEIVPNRHDFASTSFDLLDREAEDLNLREAIADAQRRDFVHFTCDDAAGIESALPYETE